MKHFISSLMILFTLNNIINARGKSGVLNISPQFSFFKDKYSDKSFIPINPGGEILYKFGLNNRLSLSSGINYSFSIWKHSIGVKSIFKRIAHEIYFPVIMEIELNHKFFTEFGFYPGWLIKGKEFWANELNNQSWRDNTKNTNYYSSPKFTADLYFGAGINHVINENVQFVLYLLLNTR